MGFFRFLEGIAFVGREGIIRFFAGLREISFFRLIFLIVVKFVGIFLGGLASHIDLLMLGEATYFAYQFVLI